MIHLNLKIQISLKKLSIQKARKILLKKKIQKGKTNLSEKSNQISFKKQKDEKNIIKNKINKIQAESIET